MSVIYDYLKKLSASSPKEFQPRLFYFQKKEEKKNKFILSFVCIGLVILGVVVYLLGEFKFEEKKETFIYRPVQKKFLKQEKVDELKEKEIPKNFIKDLKKEVEKKLKHQKLAKRVSAKEPKRAENKKIKKISKEENNLIKKVLVETSFYKRSRKNATILKINRKLKEVYLTKNYKDFVKLLKELEKIAGKDSVIVLKWKGILAFEEKRYEDAKVIFYQILKKNPFCKEARINLIYTLILLNQKELAEKEYLKFKKDFPEVHIEAKLLERNYKSSF